MRNALLHVAKMSNWKELQKSTNEGSGIGIACCVDYGTIVAQVVQVEINKDTWAKFINICKTPFFYRKLGRFMV